MFVFINPDLSLLSSPASFKPRCSYRGCGALKLCTSIPAIANYPKSSSLGHFKSNLRSTFTQTSGVRDSQQRLNKQSVQRIRCSALRGGEETEGKQLLRRAPFLFAPTCLISFFNRVVAKVETRELQLSCRPAQPDEVFITFDETSRSYVVTASSQV